MTYEEIYQAGYEDGEHDGYYSSSIEDGIEEKYFGKSFPKETTSDDCVSRKATLDAIIKELCIKDESYLLQSEKAIYNVVKNMPPVTPTCKVGKWKETRYRGYDPQLCETYDDGIGFRCSNCSNAFKVTSVIRYHYCPNCGSKMSDIPTGSD